MKVLALIGVIDAQHIGFPSILPTVWYKRPNFDHTRQQADEFDISPGSSEFATPKVATHAAKLARVTNATDGSLC